MRGGRGNDGVVVHLAGPGAGPDDGVTGYSFFLEDDAAPNEVEPARWGDYSAAVFADGAVWMANEFIPDIPRPIIEGNFGTFITKLPA